MYIFKRLRRIQSLSKHQLGNMSLFNQRHYTCRLLYKGTDLNTNLYRYQILWKSGQDTIGHGKFSHLIKVKKIYKYYNVLKKIKQFLKPFIICFVSKDIFLSEKKISINN